MDNIKRNLSNAPILAPYNLDKSLLLYVLATVIALGEMLTQKDDEGKERPIYYIIKSLIDYETRYTPIKKMCFAIIF